MNDMTPSPATDRKVVLTESAAKRIGELIALEGDASLMLRLTVSGGGCSGFQYGFSFDNASQTDDPKLEIEDLGYNFEAVGQKTYNGVAILSRRPFMVEERRLPGGDGDDHARYIEAVVDVPEGKRFKALRVASIYLPNGNPVET